MREAELIREIRFDGFLADELYPLDLEGDGQLELLALQSPGCYQSDVFDGTPWAVPSRDKTICCLTAVTITGARLWQYGSPVPDRLDYAAHVSDQMVCAAGPDDSGRRQLALLHRDRLVLLAAADGEELRSTTLAADNNCIVLPWQTPFGTRLVVKNTDAAYGPHWYGDPATILTGTLEPVAHLSGIVGSGHSPRTVDIDGDGWPELLIGYEAFDTDCRRRWRLNGRAADACDPIAHHCDQLQIGRCHGHLQLVYAGSRDLIAATADGKVSWQLNLGHPQHVLLGDFGDAAMAVLNLQVGPALAAFAADRGLVLPDGMRNGIVWLSDDGQIRQVCYPEANWPAMPQRAAGCHSGEGLLIYPQGCEDGSDAVIVRDCGWPQALAGDGRKAFAIPVPDAARRQPQAVHPNDGYGMRVCDLDGDGRAELLVHTRAMLWIFRPPCPAVAVANTHQRLRPVTGQGWYALS